MWLTGLARSRALYRREFQVSRAGSPMYSSSLALPFPFFLPRRRKQSKVDFARQSADAEPMVRWVRSGALPGAPILVEQLGGAFGELANQDGSRPDILDHPDIPIDARTVLRFHRLVANRPDCPSFGLRLGLIHDLSNFGP